MAMISSAAVDAELQALHERGMKFGLAHSVAALELLHKPHLGYARITIAGTNGKGSTAAYADAILRASGLKTGRYTSPHLVRPQERIRINGEPIDDAAWTRCAEAVLGLTRHPHGLPLTYFEAVTMMALLAFAEHGVHAAILEVGLGGRLDAVNAVDAHVAVITGIGLDHTQLLGNSIRQIAFEKAGIMRTGAPVVIAPQAHPDAKETLWGRAREIGAVPVAAGEAPYVAANGGPPGVYDFQVGRAWLKGVTPRLRYGEQNALTAAAACNELRCHDAVSARLRLLGPPRPDRLAAAISNLEMSAHSQVAERGCRFCIDGAHNPAAAAGLAAFFGLRPTHRERQALVFGAMKDKDILGMAQQFKTFFATAFCSQSRTARAASAAYTAQCFREAGFDGEIIEEPALATALERAQQRVGAQGSVLVTGSCHLAGMALEILGLPVRAG